jgi:glucose 1-dehydrogenase
MSDCRRLEGRGAVVTGAAQGLGEELAYRLGREGANVMVADFSDEKAQQVAAAIAGEYGVRTAWCHCDITTCPRSRPW